MRHLPRLRDDSRYLVEATTSTRYRGLENDIHRFDYKCSLSWPLKQWDTFIFGVDWDLLELFFC